MFILREDGSVGYTMSEELGQVMFLNVGGEARYVKSRFSDVGVGGWDQFGMHVGHVGTE